MSGELLIATRAGGHGDRWIKRGCGAPGIFLPNEETLVEVDQEPKLADLGIQQD
jgi:hypothetical protein